MPQKKYTVNRSRFRHRLWYAICHPERVPGYVRRAGRDAWLRVRFRDHVSYYRAVMKSDTTRNPESAVGSKSRQGWVHLGAVQFDYLVKHGLSPEDRMLEIGCGNLRAGWRFIEYLEPGNYYGIDISPDILFAAQQTLVKQKLQDKLPRLTPVRDLTFSFLPDKYFKVVHAHSVFSHSPLSVIDECLANVGRVMRNDGWFDFTYDRTERQEHQVLREDFYYRTETLVALAEKHGLKAEPMQDWERNKHGQSKIRITHANSAPDSDS